MPIAGVCASDEALLSGLAAGDRQTGALFVDRFQRRVYGLARSLVSDPGSAEDIAQETMIRAWGNADRYDARRGSVTTWLLAIARNLCIDSLRKRRAAPVDPETILAMLTPTREPTPGDVLSAADDAAPVRAALARLPLEQRRALILASVLGHTAKEISVMERIPLGTAKTRIRAGMLKLRASLIDDGQLQACS